MSGNEWRARSLSDGQLAVVRKHLVRLYGMPVVASAPQAYMFGSWGELALYSDYPIDVGLGNSADLMRGIQELRITRPVRQIQMRKYNAGHIGVVSVYTAWPKFPDGWRPDPPEFKQSWTWSNSQNWPAATLLVDNVALAEFSTPATYGFSGSEARYVRRACFQRDSGTINEILFRESESGTDQIQFRVWLPTPAATVDLAFDPLLRLSSYGRWVAVGSSEAGITNLDSAFTVHHV